MAQVDRPLHHSMLTLPPDLREAVAQALVTLPAEQWERAAKALSERYRAPRHTFDTPLAVGTAQALGYAALLLPPSYAQLRGAMAATAARVPGWQPRTMLDLGSGPGTALWAATAQWPALQTLTAWEREPAFVALGRELASHSAHAAVRGARWHTRDLVRDNWGAEITFDLVVLGHVLNELAPAAQAAVVAHAWQRTGGVLLIVEPGTSAAFAVVRAARDGLLGQGAYTLAPCAHDQPCPLQNDWCHFPQRLKRPDFQRRVRGAPSEWEDSKYSYAAMARFMPEQLIWARVIREPTFNKAYAEALLSTKDGIVAERALKRNRAAFQDMKELTWGDALPEPITEK